MNDIKYDNILTIIDNNDINDIKKQYIKLLSQLTEVEELSNNDFITKIKEISELGIIVIAYYKNDNKIYIVGSGTVLYEPKIIRNGKYVAHIEDIVVDENHRGCSIGKNIVNNLINYSKEKECYKIILDCSNDLISFYEKLGFLNIKNEMSLYFI